eukprot:TRINITY_DN20818_c0_g1_i2.p1 TRINITY_DN20818_c0_g1~~TRINITY_DN20818_c0_g1_i2.p1  ORF type:complete len:164 (-),score=22.88 TRINITY_DN20818_c0_g1_i2:146-637(-)
MLWEYPRGALNVEAVSTDGSEIYPSIQRKISDKHWQKQQRSEMKMGNLLANLSRVQYCKYDPLKEGMEAGAWSGPDKWFQSKMRIPGSSSFAQSTKTHDIRPVPPGRTQNIRNCTSKGRQYNILSGAQIEVIPPSIPEGNENQALRSIHPSVNQRDMRDFRVG